MRRIIASFLTYHTHRNNFISVNTISKNTEKLLVDKKTRRKLQGFHSIKNTMFVQRNGKFQVTFSKQTNPQSNVLLLLSIKNKTIARSIFTNHNCFTMTSYILWN